jgi:hypothetical protein
VDVAKFTDVATTDVTGMTRYGNDLVLQYGNLNGQLTVEKNYFYNDNANYRVDTFDFTNADWSVTDIKSQVITRGTELSERSTATTRERTGYLPTAAMITSTAVTAMTRSMAATATIPCSATTATTPCWGRAVGIIFTATTATTP